MSRVSHKVNAAKLLEACDFHSCVTLPCPAISPPNTISADFAAQVIDVLDGDTIKVLHNNHAERIRLNGIDCPEKGQAYGKRAKQTVSELVFGKEVTLNTFGRDKYRRTIADVLLADGNNGLSEPAE